MLCARVFIRVYVVYGCSGFVSCVHSRMCLVYVDAGVASVHCCVHCCVVLCCVYFDINDAFHCLNFKHVCVLLCAYVCVLCMTYTLMCVNAYLLCLMCVCLCCILVRCLCLCGVYVCVLYCVYFGHTVLFVCVFVYCV